MSITTSPFASSLWLSKYQQRIRDLLGRLDATAVEEERNNIDIEIDEAMTEFRAEVKRAQGKS